MKYAIADSIRTLLNRSPIPAAVIDRSFTLLWNNQAYETNYKHFLNINEFAANFPQNYYSSIEDFLTDIKKTSLTLDNGLTITKDHVQRFDVSIISIFSNKDTPHNEINIDIYSNLFKNFHRPCVIFDYPSGKLIDANDALLKLSGLPLIHFMSLKLQDIFYSGMNTIYKYLSNYTPYLKPFIISFTTLDGGFKFLEISPSVIGGLNHTVLFDIEDITFGVRSHFDDIKDSYKYAFLYKNISDGLILWQNYKIIDSNSVACRLWGYEKKQLIGMDLFALCNFDKKEDIFSTLSDEDIIESNFVGIKKDSSSFDGKLITRMLEANQQRIYITLVSDLSEHYKYSLMEDRYRTIEDGILNSQRSIIMVYDNEDNLIRVNNSFLEFFKCRSIKEFIMKYSTVETQFKEEGKYLKPDCGQDWYKGVFSNSNKEYYAKIRNISEDIDYIFSISVNAFTLEKDMYVVTLSDVTETMQTAMALKDANSILLMHTDNVKSEMQINIDALTQQSKLAMMGEMIGIITHQWKQPLNAIGLIAQNIEDILIEDETIDRTEIIEMMCSIMRNVKSMGETVDNFKDFFKNNNSDQWFNLLKAVDSALLLLEPVLNKFRINITKTYSESSNNFYINGFPNEFKQVLLNIIINARDAIAGKINAGLAEYGSGVVDIMIESLASDTVQISVRDNGTGLADDVIEKIFNMQYTTKGEQGSGIGMYMTKMIIKKMSGKIYANNWEKGASITIELPVRNIVE